jgi:hypothetical protein
MSLVFRKQGAVDLFVIAGRDTDTAKECPPPEQDGDGNGNTCLEEERAAFGVVYSERLAFVKPPDTVQAPKPDTSRARSDTLRPPGRAGRR